MKTVEDLNKLRDQVKSEAKKHTSAGTTIMVGMATCGCAAGATQVMDAILAEVAKRKLDVTVSKTGCIGACESEPLVDVIRPDEPRITYKKVKPEDIPEIIEKHVIGGQIVADKVFAKIAAEDQKPMTVAEVPNLKDIPFYKKQVRNVLANCGTIDPEEINEYIGTGGYQALAKVLTTMKPQDVIDEVLASGLRGRGGGGFPTGRKWSFAAKSTGDKKYIICNADEGDPGAFMDRSVLECDPHRLIEGMAIAAYAIGADEGYIYCRAEYPLAIKHLKTALKQAEELGLMGDNIFNSGFNFRLRIKEGAGAFVCGEETALMASIEGKRGMPRPRPPFPAVAGLWMKPTNINNVETYANVPHLIMMGGAKYAETGTEKSKGTKVFALTGKINNTGLAEVPMGITMREIIYEVGGGIPDGKKFKAVQIGGPSGGCLPENLLDLQIDYDSLIKVGAMMGSGGLVVMDETTCMVDVARFFLNFTCSESCGKCTPCREGTKRMLEILERITEGKGEPEDIPTLEKLAKNIKQTALCGLGQTAPNPVLSTLRYFRNEYEAHIFEKRCPAGACQNLLSYTITDKCVGCTACTKVCPVGAISGEKKSKHAIDPKVCIKCGACAAKCPVGAIVKQ